MPATSTTTTPTPGAVTAEDPMSPLPGSMATSSRKVWNENPRLISRRRDLALDCLCNVEAVSQ